MRLSRIIVAIAVGLTVTAAPTAAGAALSQPQPPPPLPSPPLPYQPQPPRMTVSPSTITLGETVTVAGTGFTPGERGRIDAVTDPRAAGAQGARLRDGQTGTLTPVAFHRTDAAQPEAADNAGRGGPWDGPSDGSPRTFWVTATEDGQFSFTYRPRRAGTVVFTATGEDSGRTATAVLTVLRERDESPLPVTGSAVSTPLKVGGGLAGAGALLMLTTFAWRRRGRSGADVTF